MTEQKTFKSAFFVMNGKPQWAIFTDEGVMLSDDRVTWKSPVPDRAALRAIIEQSYVKSVPLTESEMFDRI